MSRVTTRNSDEQGNDHLRGLDQPGSRSYADRNTAAAICITGGAVSERQEFSQIIERVPGAAKTVLGSTSVGQGILGSFEWQCDGRGMERLHQKPNAAGTG